MPPDPSSTAATTITGTGPDAEQGGGPPAGQPWTLIVESESWSADLEHAAPMPRVGELIEYIAEDGARHTYRVREIVHTVQSAASERPAVGAEDSLPNTTVSGPRPPNPTPRELRAGLPRVYVDVGD
jgi:hypothetical protein